MSSLANSNMTATTKHTSRGQAWFCTTGLPSDVVFEVGEMTFHLHKFPLVSKSGKIHRLITEQDQNHRERQRRRRRQMQPYRIHKEHESAEQVRGEIEIEEEEDQEEKGESSKASYHIALVGFPGGPGTFETAAKFCYGVKVELTAWNVAPLRCAAEYLEMTEDFMEDNLISRTERYLTQSVLRHLSEACKALKSCEDLMPFADELGLVQRCVDSIAVRVSYSDPTTLFGWPVNEGSNGMTPSHPVLWNGLDTGIRRRGGPRSLSSADSWLNDMSFLGLTMYKRVIAAMIARDVSSEAIEGSLVAYANRSMPGISRSSRQHASAPVVSETEQRELLETIITSLPMEKSSDVVSTRFLFGLLKTANILRASEDSKTALERKIALQLERATVDDLLIPNYSYLVETLYDVNCIERIFKYFLELAETSASAGIMVGEEGHNGTTPAHVRTLMRVGKLLDSYLAEIASDPNLKPDKFCELALVLPDHARVYDDGLYRAVDIYLKAHGKITGEDRERVCGVVASRKLTVEACTHAAQNERLPLRAVLQVLFFEQLQLRRAIAGNLFVPEQQMQRGQQVTRGRGSEGGGVAGMWQTAVRENQVLRLDMDSMRSRVQELERECSTMKKAIQKIDGRVGNGNGSDHGSSDSAGGRKGRYGCRFSTQVCDSHERTVVLSRPAASLELSP